MSLFGIGCGDDDDSPRSSAEACRAQLSGEHATTDAGEARQAGIAYFLSCDPASCTEDATEHLIEADYGGSLAQCEAVRRNNQLAKDDISFNSQAEVTGSSATLGGRVLVTDERFKITLRKVEGSWKVDRIRGSQ